ncbi:MAG: SEC-C domain-containing protein, partial [Anaerolineae bacterium]|nr:SEC-C domain-containing protein [Anaerolineae bacterium]
IDNQLRGRSGRQGDPGASRFFLSMEDDLMRRFGGERVKNLMERLTLPEDEPIEHNLVSKVIQQTQVRMEGYNFDIRKRLLDYDDVVNKQREVIYAQRRSLLDAENLREEIIAMADAQLEALTAQFLSSDFDDTWDLEELYRECLKVYPVPTTITPETWAGQDRKQIEESLREGVRAAYTEKEAEIGPEIMRRAERAVALEALDSFWRRHLTDLDVLREGIGLMSVAQRDPLVEYQREAFQMWRSLQDEIHQRTVQNIFRVQLRQEPQPRVQNIRAVQGSTATTAPEPVRATAKDKLGRNDPCWCGSGKKYKHCHYQADQQERRTHGVKS